MSEDECPSCRVPLQTFKSAAGTTWQDCPFTSCAAHGTAHDQPCWGEVRCYDEAEIDDGQDFICYRACEGHIDQQSALAYGGTPEPYQPRQVTPSTT